MTKTEIAIIETNVPSLSTIAALAAVPEEEVWLAKQKSARTRRAYRLDVTHFIRTLRVSSSSELRQVDHRAVIAWERFMRETEGAQASTIRRRLAALSSLFKHLVAHNHAARNPVADVGRPTINREEGSPWPFPRARPARCSTLLPPSPSKACAIAPFSPSACKSACAAPKSRR